MYQFGTSLRPAFVLGRINPQPSKDTSYGEAQCGSASTATSEIVILLVG